MTQPLDKRLVTEAALATAVAGLVAGAPGALNTLKELADALGDDANLAATLSAAIAGKASPVDVSVAVASAIAALASVAHTGAYSDLTGKPTLGTAAAHAVGDFDAAGAAAAALTAAAADATAKVAAEAASLSATSLALNLPAWTLVQAFRVVSATRDGNEAITTASVVWPDGATGTFTTDTASTAFPGAIDAYHVTHVLAGTTKTVTQTAVTRDAGGAVTAQPALTVA